MGKIFKLKVLFTLKPYLEDIYDVWMVGKEFDRKRED